MRTKKIAVLFGLVSAVLLACGSKRESGFDETAAADGGAPPGPSLGNDNKAMVNVSLSGTVYAPNGNLPLSTALVYLTSAQPAPIPEGVYCDECVALTAGTFAVSAPDGKFSIKTDIAKGTVYLVVQKGQFRRVREIKVEEAGVIDVTKDDTTLPAKMDITNGDTIPKMVILKDETDFDAIDVSLGKLGLTGLEIQNSRALLENATELMKYQIVFIPCGESSPPEMSSDTAKENLRKFVEAGGKLYVTDWSYEFVRQPFPGYLTWDGETDEMGSGASGDEWDAPAHADDTGLADWLTASGSASFSVQGNWTTINAVNTVSGQDPKGNPVDVTPKVWISGSKETDSTDHPTTVSFENKCGRVLYSTYHTEGGLAGSGASAPLQAQEKALLYVLLEVGVCIGERPGVH